MILNQSHTPATTVDVSRADKPLCILVVEDDSDSRRLYRQALVHDCFVVNTALDGEAGWAALQANNYDLLIIDNHLPKMSGLELVEKARQAKMSLPVILASGAPPSNHEHLGFASILLKPFTTEELGRAVKDILACGH